MWLGFVLPPLLVVSAAAYECRGAFGRWRNSRNGSAYRSARLRLSKASDACGIAHALRDFVASRTAVEHYESDRVLEEFAEEETIAEYRNVLQQCEIASFAGQPEHSSARAAALYDQARRCLERLHRELPGRPYTAERKSNCKLGVSKVGSRGIAAGFLATVIAVGLVASNEAAAIELTRDQQRQLLSEADMAYDKGLRLADSDSAESKDAFVTAARKYQLVGDSGLSSDRLFFNLGNAYLQAGSRGRAIAAYEMAVNLDPQSEAKTNLKYVRNLLGFDAADSTSGIDFTGRLQKWNKALPSQLRSGIALVSWVMCCSAGALSILRGRHWHWVAVSTGIVFVLCTASWYLVQKTSFSIDRAVVVAPVTELRSGNGDSFATTGTEFKEGATLEVLESRGDLDEDNERRSCGLDSEQRCCVHPKPFGNRQHFVV